MDRKEEVHSKDKMSFRKSFVNSLRSVSSRVVVPKGASQRLKDLTSSVKGTLERSGVCSK